MKKILFIVLVSLSFAAKAQYVPSLSYGQEFQRFKPLKVLHLPVFTDDTTLQTTDTSAQIRINNGVLQYHYYGRWWDVAGTSTGGTELTFTPPLLNTSNTVTVGGLSGLGTNNQILAMNNAGTNWEYKTITTSAAAVSNDVGVTLSGANAIVINLPSASATNRGLTTTGTQTFAGLKTYSNLATFNAGMTLNVGSDATGDLHYRSAGGPLARLGIGSNGQFLTISGGALAWGSASSLDTTSLSNRINLKLNVSDTAAMLSPYLRSNIAAATYSPLSHTHIIGNVTGLQAALDAKQATITTGTTAQYFRGDLSLATFPTAVSSFTNDAGYLTLASNFANTNLTLTGNRTHTGAGFSMLINGLSSFEAASPNASVSIADAGIDIENNDISGYVNIAGMNGSFNMGAAEAKLLHNSKITLDADEFHVDGLTGGTGAGYVLTDVAGDGNLTLEAPTGGGSLTNLTATDNTGQAWTITNPTTTPNLSLALTSAAVGLGNVNNTSDANKPVSTATQTALDLKLNISDTAAMLLPYLRSAEAGGGAVSSVANSDGSLTISPTTGAVVASLNPANANTWTARQTNQLTTEQLRLAYDASNYLAFTVGSTGASSLTTSAGALTVTNSLIPANGFQTNATGVNANLYVPSSATTVNTTNSNYRWAGAASTEFRVGIRGSTNSTLTAGANYGTFVIGTETMIEAASGTHPMIASHVIKQATVTNGAAATTDMASLYIEDAPTGITPTGESYALFTDAGKVRFDLGSDAAGDIFYRTTAGSLARLGVGTNGDVLTLASGLPSWAAPSGGGGTTVISLTFASSPYTVLPTSGETVYLVDASGGAVTLNLPTAVSNTAKYVIKKIDASTNTVTVDASASQTIDDGLTAAFTVQYTSISLVGNNENWFIF